MVLAYFEEHQAWQRLSTSGNIYGLQREAANISCVFASTNAALDNVTNAIYKARPKDLGDKKVLRIEIGSMEEFAMLKSEAFDKVTPKTLYLQKPPQWTENEDLIYQDPAYAFFFMKRNLYLYIYILLLHNQKSVTYTYIYSPLMRSILCSRVTKQERDLKKAYELVQNAARQERAQNVSLATTLHFWNWEHAMRDTRKPPTTETTMSQPIDARILRNRVRKHGICHIG